MALDGGDLESLYLETERLVLRRFTEADVDLLVELDSDPDVTHFITNGRATPRDEIEGDVLPALLGYYDRPEGYGFWAVIERSTDAFIGWFHLRPGPAAAVDEPELGYRLRSSAWGKGYATEGSRALVQKAFTELGATRVIAQTMAVHIASRRVMEKAGLTLARTFYQDWPYPIEGEEEGVVEYALSKADWEMTRRELGRPGAAPIDRPAAP